MPATARPVKPAYDGLLEMRSLVSAPAAWRPSPPEAFGVRSRLPFVSRHEFLPLRRGGNDEPELDAMIPLAGAGAMVHLQHYVGKNGTFPVR